VTGRFFSRRSNTEDMVGLIQGKRIAWVSFIVAVWLLLLLSGLEAQAAGSPSAHRGYPALLRVSGSSGIGKEASAQGPKDLGAIPSNVSLVSVSITPNSTTLGRGEKQVFTAVPFCSGGNCPSEITYKWNISWDEGFGTLNATSGVSVYYEAGSLPANLTLYVNATLNGTTVHSSPAHITQTYWIRPLNMVTVDPYRDLVLFSNGSNQLSAWGSCDGPCVLPETYSWSLTNDLGNLNSTHYQFVTFTAGDAPGNLTAFINATVNGTTLQGPPIRITILRPTPMPVLSSIFIEGEWGIVNNTPQPFVAAPQCLAGSCRGANFTWSLTNYSMASLTISSDSSAVIFQAGSHLGNVSICVNGSLNGRMIEGPIIELSIGPPATSPQPITRVASWGVWSLFTNDSQPFMAAITCPQGVCSPGTTYQWSLTNSSLATLNSTDTPGLAVLRAGSHPGAVDVTVNATLMGKTVTGTQHVVIYGVYPSAANVSGGGSQVFSASSEANSPGAQCSWTLTNGLGKLNASSGPSVTFTSGRTEGRAALFLNVTEQGTVIQSRPIPITIGQQSPEFVSASVSPTSATLIAGRSQSFAAAPVCEGGPCPSGATFSWILTNSMMGTLNATTGPTVVFTAGSSAGSDTLFVNVTLNGQTKQSSPVAITIHTIPPSPNSSSSQPGFLGLPDPEGYYVLGIGAAAGVAVVAVWVRALLPPPKKNPPPPQGVSPPPPRT